MSNYDKTSHIDQLAEWWENAEDAPASPGDRIIERHVCERDEDTYYTIGVHREGMRGLIGKSGTRILERAPKPKPSWHDAIAVIAHTDSEVRQVWVREGSTWWADGMGLDAYSLRDVTPLIEAKVTDEMVERYWDAMRNPGSNYDEAVRHALAAALGLETE